MKKFIAVLGLCLLLGACASEPAELVNESNFVEFWETADFSAHTGNEIVTGKYLMTTLYTVEFYLDEDSLTLVPPTYLEGERYFIFDADGEAKFMETVGLGWEDLGCSYEGTATIEIVDYAVSKQEGFPDEVILSEVIEFSEPEFLWCETP
jgi:hypothetical protein